MIVDAGNWIALGALIVSIVALVVGIRANKHADRSATASEHSAAAAQGSAEEATRANDAADRRAMPTLIVHPRSDRTADPKARTAEVKMPVQSAGGRSRDVIVITDWGEAQVEPPVLESGQTGEATAQTHSWEDGTYPVPSAVRFKDDQGRQQELTLLETSPNVWTTP